MFLHALALAAVAVEGAPSPNVGVGDTWTYDRTAERGPQGFNDQRLDLRIERVGADTMVVGVKPMGSPRDFEDNIVGLDWSKRRLVDGRQTVTGRPLTFPMTIGKTWSTDYVDPTPHGRQLSAHFTTRYRVVGMEDVTTPAGSFHAYKVVGEGGIEAQFAPAAGAVSAVTATPTGATTVTHLDKAAASVEHATTYEEFFYDPKVKYFVKSVEEQYNKENVRTSRITQTLQAYTVKP